MKALILVDIQNDFCPGGTLPVPEGDLIVPLVNALQAKFSLIAATQDWHPPGHKSFAANHPGREPGEMVELNGAPQVLWPVHCVQNTQGAAFVPGLDVSRVARVFQKGENPDVDSYSGFFDNDHRRATGLGDWLRGQGVEELWVCGLATDYCVKATALDARQLGFAVTLIQDACRGVNLHEGDVAQALEAMRQSGVRVVKSDAV